METVTPALVDSMGLAATLGAVVTSVEPESPAEAAGLRTGDVIIAVADVPISNVEELLVLLRQREDDALVGLTRVRGATDEATVVVQLIHKSKRRTRGITSRGEQPESKTRGLSDAIEQETASHSVVRVYYATDRNRTGSSDPNLFYGPDRGELVYGVCDVTIPANHTEGEIEAPSMMRLEFSEDPSKHVVLASVEEQSVSEFYKEMAKQIAESGGSKAFIFVHGYNVNFKDAAKRTAQMAFDLKFAGAPVFFSWPSTGRYLGYKVDEANVEFGRSDLKRFISQFAAQSTAQRIYVIAHSMGNRALTAALGEVLRESPDARAKIKEVILAAPDVDADVFKKEIAPALTAHGQNVTLYASSNDWALIASKAFHGYPRAGDSGEKLTIVEGVSTIDSSDVPTGFLGHSYFAEASPIIDDIGALFAGSSSPEARQNLERLDGPKGRYWRLTEPPSAQGTQKNFEGK